MAAAVPDATVDAGLAGPWRTYRDWETTAAYHQRAIDRLSQVSLRLAIGGAIAATLGEQLDRLPLPQLPRWVPRSVGTIGAAAVTLAAFFARQAQADGREGIWTRCREAAEALKSALLLYRAAAPPYDGGQRAARIAEQVGKIRERLGEVELRQPVDEAVPSLGPLSIDDYIAERVQEQIEWYRRRAREHQVSADRYRRWMSALAAISALLTVAAVASTLSLWAPVVATITASITAQFQNRRYQALIAKYQATAQRLDDASGEWAASGRSDADRAERNAFIQRCEEIMASENGAWLALWSKKGTSVAPAAPGPTPVPPAK